jgi:ribonuclease E
VSVSLLRRIEARAASGSIQGVRVQLHPELADAFQNGRRKELSDLEQEFDLKIEVIAAPGLHRPDEQIEWFKREKPLPPPKPRPAAVTLQPWDLALPGLDEEEDEEESKAPPKVAKAARGRERQHGGRAAARPAEPLAEEAAAGETEGEAKRRKRRRGGRKRKKGNGVTVGAPAESAAFQAPVRPEATPAEPQEPEDREEPGFEDEGADDAPGVEAESGAAGKRDRNRRRRRRRGGARSREAKGTGEPGAEPADGPAPEDLGGTPPPQESPDS